MADEEFNATLVKVLSDEPVGYRPAGLGDLLRAVASVYSTTETDALLQGYATDLELTALAGSIADALAAKAPLNSPTFTGQPRASTPLLTNNSTQLATTAFVQGLLESINAAILTRAPLDSPTLTGAPKATTPSGTDESTRIATTAFVKAVISTAFAVTEIAKVALRYDAAQTLNAAQQAQARANAGLVIGTDVQAFNQSLKSIADLTTTANQLTYSTGATSYAATAFTPFARSILDDPDAVTVRGTIGANNAGNLTEGLLSPDRIKHWLASTGDDGFVYITTSLDGNTGGKFGMTSAGNLSYGYNGVTLFRVLANGVMDNVQIPVGLITGLGSLATKSTVNNDDWSGADLSIANGGTGASSAGAARAALGTNDAANLTTGIVATARLSGTYNVSITGTADGNIEKTTAALGDVFKDITQNMIGSTALLKRTGGGSFTQGTTSIGSALEYSNADGSFSGSNPSGTWMCMGRATGGAAGGAAVTDWKRIA